MIELKSIAPNIVIDLRYATPNNFTNQIIYTSPRCLLVPEAAYNLQRAQLELESMNLGLKVWDAFRPMEARWKLWNLIADERYVSDPRKGGRHTRGTAVDVTLVTKEGDELPMPSTFDDFSEKAHRSYTECGLDAIHNRELLYTVMTNHNFSGIPTEWWHFDLSGWESYEPRCQSR